jgi:hypothetical protein
MIKSKEELANKIKPLCEKVLFDKKNQIVFFNKCRLLIIFQRSNLMVGKKHE